MCYSRISQGHGNQSDSADSAIGSFSTNGSSPSDHQISPVSTAISKGWTDVIWTWTPLFNPDGMSNHLPKHSRPKGAKTKSKESTANQQLNIAKPLAPQLVSTHINSFFETL
eukprot:s188_g34.t1